MKPCETNQLNFEHVFRTWITGTVLLLNLDKSEVLVLVPKHLWNSLSNDIATLAAGCYRDMSFNSNIKQISRTTPFHLYYIAKMGHFLNSKNNAEQLIHTFIRLVYCNSLLLGCPTGSPQTLQLVQDAVAHVLSKSRKRDHISPVLAYLHWLPLQSRI